MLLRCVCVWLLMWRGKSAVEVCVWLLMWRYSGGERVLLRCVCVVTDVEGEQCC